MHCISSIGLPYGFVSKIPRDIPDIDMIDQQSLSSEWLVVRNTNNVKHTFIFIVFGNTIYKTQLQHSNENISTNSKNRTFPGQTTKIDN